MRQRFVVIIVCVCYDNSCVGLTNICSYGDIGSTNDNGL